MDQDIVLDATGITKHFGALQVLHGVDLQVRRGEALGVVGPNGAGKTTLFGVVAGTLPASGGPRRRCCGRGGSRVEREGENPLRRPRPRGVLQAPHARVCAAGGGGVVCP